MRPLPRCSATCTSLLECSRWAKSSVLKKLFELLYLAERYEVGNLKTKTEDALQSLTLTQENMIFTATVAKKFKKVFDNTSTKMLMRCLNFNNLPEANLEILHELVSIGSDSLHLPGSY